jgi:hypothetical protein
VRSLLDMSGLSLRWLALDVRYTTHRHVQAAADPGTSLSSARLNSPNS